MFIGALTLEKTLDEKMSLSLIKLPTPRYFPGFIRTWPIEADGSRSIWLRSLSQTEDLKNISVCKTSQEWPRQLVHNPVCISLTFPRIQIYSSGVPSKSIDKFLTQLAHPGKVMGRQDNSPCRQVVRHYIIMHPLLCKVYDRGVYELQNEKERGRRTMAALTRIVPFKWQNFNAL